MDVLVHVLVDVRLHVLALVNILAQVADMNVQVHARTHAQVVDIHVMGRARTAVLEHVKAQAAVD